MKLIKVVLLSITLILTSCSAKLTSADIISRTNADKIIEENELDNVKGFNHIIFSVAEKDFIIIVEKQDCYIEYFYKKGNDNIITKNTKVIYNKPNDLLKKIFNKTIYKKDFITFNSKFFSPQYEISSGNITYFVFKDEKDKRYGEARLSFFIKPNPIDAEIYLYLTNQILKYNSNY